MNDQLGLFVIWTVLVSSAERSPMIGDRPFYLLKNAGDLEAGRQQYASVVSSSKLPHYGDCWTSALNQLHDDCDALTDESNARLALVFANCFLGRAGQKTYPCASTDETSSCTRSMDGTAFHAYTTFFTHTMNMCFFLKSQVWHEETEGTIGRLLDTSSKVQSQMSEHMELQRLSLQNDRRLLDHGRELNKAVESSKAGVHQILAEFQESTGEQRLFIAEMFDRVLKFHTLVIGEFAGVYSFVFFIIAVALCYLLTSTKRTADARLYLFCIVVANLAVEKLAIQWRLEENVLMNSDNAQNIIYSRVWVIRKISAYLALITLVVSAFRYRDLTVVNNEMLKTITRQNLEITSRLNSIGTAIESNHKTARHQRNAGTQSSSDDLDMLSTSYEDLLLSPKRTRENRTADEVTSVENVLQAITNIPKTKQRKSRGRNSSINDSQQLTPRESPYNLRNRKPVSTMNPIVRVEPPERFAATIARLAEISAANSLTMRKVLKEHRTIRYARFSSDED